MVDNQTAAENAVHTVHVKHFDLTRQTFAPGGAAWQSLPWRLAGSAWYESPGDRCRIYFNTQIIEWRNGAAPWAESEIHEVEKCASKRVGCAQLLLLCVL